MRILFITALCLFAYGSCDRKDNDEKETQQDIGDLIQIKNLYCGEESEPVIDEILNSHRCDKLPFKALYVAFCGRGSTSGHYDDGKWLRWDQSTDEPCFKDGQDLGSKSECSGDGIIMESHVWISQWDQPKASRTVQYLESNDWVCGEGYSGYTGVKQIKWLTKTVRDYLEKKPLPTPVEIQALMAASGLVDFGDLLKEFNKYLVAFHAYAFGRMNHAFSDKTMDILKDLVNSSPDSMIFQSIYNRYLDGDQRKAIELIKKECPSDKIPMDTDYAGWGSSPRVMHCIAAISILEGM